VCPVSFIVGKFPLQTGARRAGTRAWGISVEFVRERVGDCAAGGLAKDYNYWSRGVVGGGELSCGNHVYVRVDSFMLERDYI
jgi:hypothetical protein